MTAPALELQGVSVRFGDAPGLEGVSLAVASGERLALLGPSGAGKTTLLRVIAGLQPCVAGRVRIAGQDVTSLAPEARGATYLHQSPLLFPHLSVVENVAFPLRVRGVPEAEVIARAGQALEAVRLAALGGRMPRTLSGGQAHRVALARAMVARPPLLLLDEPLASLDPALRQEVREALLALQAAYGPAVVLVTHDLEDAGVLGDRIGVIADRRLAQLAPAAELFARPASLAVARLLGMPNEVAGDVRAGRFTSPLGTVATELPDGPATAIFRADALVPDAHGAIEATVLGVRVRPEKLSLRVTVGSRVFEASAPDGIAPAPGTALRLTVRAERLHCFATGGGA